MAGPQLLHLTTTNSFTLVEKNPKAIIKLELSGSKQKSGTFGSLRTLKSTEGSLGTMANPLILRADTKKYEEKDREENSPEEVIKEEPAEPEVRKATTESKTCCFCIPWGSKKSKSAGSESDISMMQVDNEQSIKKPLMA